jgi:hypothetical protein
MVRVGSVVDNTGDQSENGSRFERKGKRTLVEDHENEEDVQRREEDTCPEWDGGYEQVDGDGGPEQLGEVGHDDSGFGQEVERVQQPPAVPELVRTRSVVQREAAVDGEVVVGHATESGRQDLEQEGHEAGEEDDEEVAVTEFGPGGQVRDPVAGIEICGFVCVSVSIRASLCGQTSQDGRKASGEVHHRPVRTALHIA